MSEKSIFNFKIQYKDGTVIDLHEDKNIWVSSFRIFSPKPDHVTEKIDGRHGSVLLETIIGERKLHAKFSVEAVDPAEFDLLRDELFRIFNPLNKFYIIRDLQPGKRMEVSVDGDFNLDYLTLEDGEFELDFVMHSPYLESVITTLNPFQLEGYSQMSTSGEVKYRFSENTFSVWNEGDITVNPKIHSLAIIFEGLSTGLSIKNLTTGEEAWTFNGPTIEGDTLLLEGIRAFKNGVSIFSQTNRKLIPKLVPGWNEFEIAGATGPFEISFDFRFYYL
jgi:phage-related protein